MSVFVINNGGWDVVLFRIIIVFGFLVLDLVKKKLYDFGVFVFFMIIFEVNGGKVNEVIFSGESGDGMGKVKDVFGGGDFFDFILDFEDEDSGLLKEECIK